MTDSHALTPSAQVKCKHGFFVLSMGSWAYSQSLAFMSLGELMTALNKYRWKMDLAFSASAKVRGCSSVIANVSGVFCFCFFSFSWGLRGGGGYLLQAQTCRLGLNSGNLDTGINRDYSP